MINSGMTQSTFCFYFVMELEKPLIIPLLFAAYGKQRKPESWL